MINETVLNIDKIVPYLHQILSNVLIIFGITFIVISLINVIGRYAKDKLDNKKDVHFKDKDVEVVSEAFKKVGEVKTGTKNEVILNKQNVENNKEIHANNLKYDELEQRVEKIEKYMQDMNDDIQLQLKSILEKLKRE